MARKRKAAAEKQESGGDSGGASEENEQLESDGEELVEEGKLICALTQEQRPETDQEKTLQSFIEQLHLEYGIPLELMARDVRVICEVEDAKSGGTKKKSRTISLAVYEEGADRTPDNIIRVAVIVPPKTKPEEQNLVLLNDLLGAIGGSREEVFGIWSNGTDLAFRMRRYDRTGQPRYLDLTDIPAPDETLKDLETADRRPLRIATGDSLLRTFKRCHDYIYGNQGAKSDKAFLATPVLDLCEDLRRKAVTSKLLRGRNGGQHGRWSLGGCEENPSALRRGRGQEGSVSRRLRWFGASRS